MSPQFFNESVNIYRIPTVHQALGKVAAQNICDPILKSGYFKPCAPDANDVRNRNKVFLTSTRKPGDGSELKGTSRRDPDMTVIFWEPVRTRANLGGGVVVVVGQSKDISTWSQPTLVLTLTEVHLCPIQNLTKQRTVNSFCRQKGKGEEGPPLGSTHPILQSQSQQPWTQATK